MPQSLEEKIAEINQQSWTIHSLYQGEGKWEARIKLKDSGLAYANGEGPTPLVALENALAAGMERLLWRPSIKPADTSGRSNSPPSTKKTSSTDDLMKGLDL